MVVSLRAIFRGHTPGQWHENQKRSKIINIKQKRHYISVLLRITISNILRAIKILFCNLAIFNLFIILIIDRIIYLQI